MEAPVTQVLVSGCFDILHAGHIQFLEDAKRLGDSLIVCIPSDRVIRELKGREPALPQDNRCVTMYGVRYADVVVIGDAPDPVLNFSEFLQHGMILASTADDQHAARKQALCELVGATYVQLPKTGTQCTPACTTTARRRAALPAKVPLRVDFAGGWLDVPECANPNAYVVNCAISPLVSVDDWPYHKKAGLGGSASWAMLQGRDPVRSELEFAGWQDAAIVQETGVCAWRSGPTPVLQLKRDGAWLHGLMALKWTGQQHSTAALLGMPRNYERIAGASRLAANAVMCESVHSLALAIRATCLTQMRDEGMEPLVTIGPNPAAWKYCGSGHGGYALCLYETSDDRQRALDSDRTMLAIEPYEKWADKCQT